MRPTPRSACRRHNAGCRLPSGRPPRRPWPSAVRRARPRRLGGAAANHPAAADAPTRSTRLRGLGDPLDLDEVEEVYLPLSRLLTCTSRGAERLHGAPRDVPRRGRAAAHAVRHRRRRLGRRRQVHDRPGAARAARPLARAPAGRAGHHRRLPATQRRAGAARPDARKGFPESYDRRRCCGSSTDVKSGAEEVEAPVYSHLTTTSCRRADRRAPARHPDRRGPQRAAARPAAPDGRRRPGGQRLLRLLDLRRRRAPTTSAAGTSTGSCGCGDRVRRPGVVLPPVRRADRRRGGASTAARSGTRSTSRTSCRTSCPTRGRATLVLTQGRRPRGPAGPAAQALTRRERRDQRRPDRPSRPAHHVLLDRPPARGVGTVPDALRSCRARGSRPAGDA